MDNLLHILLASIGGILAGVLLLMILLSGFRFRRVGLALRTGGRMLWDGDFAARVAPLLAPPKTEDARSAKPSGVPLRMLALLQREGRLLDFLMENIAEYPDAQIGAAVRDIHRQCRAAILEHLVIEPVVTKEEGSTVEVPAGFDPSAIRLTGNVTGQPPFRGTLQHHGWRVTQIKLAALPEGQDELILMPAEVELF